MYGYQGKAVRAGSAQGAVKVFSAGRWRLFRAGAGATFETSRRREVVGAVPRGRGRDSGSSRRLTIPRRLEACKQLGWKTIPAIVLDYSAANDDATAELLAELAEIDENLKRNDLTELQQGIQHAQRKRIYEALHPEAKAAIGAELVNKRWNTADNLSVVSYAADAATATGETERTVRRKNLIGEQLESVAEQLSGTAIEDNQSELLALAKLQESKPEIAAVVIEKLVAERDKPAQLGGPEPVAIEEKAAAKEPDKKPKPQPQTKCGLCKGDGSGD